MSASEDWDINTHFVYRLFDKSGALLYIGCTRDVEQRVYMHRRTTGTGCWFSIWTRYDHHTSESYPTKAEALAAERAAIRAELPELNVQGKPRITSAPTERAS